MKEKLIQALADVLDVDLSKYEGLSDSQILALLEDQQAQAVATV